MELPRVLGLAGGLAVMAAAALPASAQNEAPFTIRRPPDGATVREKVRIQVPLASIPEGGYVAYSIDGKFIVALAPTEEQREKARPGATFDFIWDTKAPMKVQGSLEQKPPAEGEHEISATLYVPRPGEDGGSIARETSSVKVVVANKINTDPGAVRLRYRFNDGATHYYNRTGTTSIVAGLSQAVRGTGEQEIAAQKSQLLVAVEDIYPERGEAIIRNKLMKLTVRQGGQEVDYPTNQLPKSLYQQVSPIGRVVYQNDTVSLDAFAQMGIPVDTTLKLPILPTQPVRVGDSWQTPSVPLDVPGVAPGKEPKATLTSTFEGIEWEGGYPTARIHQKLESAPSLDSLQIGNIDVNKPKISYERDVFLAYRSGLLVKVVRNVEITGTTSTNVGVGAPAAAAAPTGMMPGGPPAAMMGAMMGSGAPYGGPGARAGMAGPPGGSAMMSAMMGGYGGRGGRPGVRQGAPGGRTTGTRAGRAMPGAMSGMPGTMGPGGMRGGPSMPGAAGPYGGTMTGPPAGMMSGMMGAPRMPATGPRLSGTTGPQQITLKSVTVTELDRSAGRAASLR